MPAPELAALESMYSSVLAMMEPYFDSHDFIRRLAHAHQRLYVAALAAYADHPYPFQIVHGDIARRLLNHPELVQKIGEQDSLDIFHQKNSATVWRRLS